MVFSTLALILAGISLPLAVGDEGIAFLLTALTTVAAYIQKMISILQRNLSLYVSGTTSATSLVHTQRPMTSYRARYS